MQVKLTAGRSFWREQWRKQTAPRSQAYQHFLTHCAQSAVHVRNLAHEAFGLIVDTFTCRGVIHRLASKPPNTEGGGHVVEPHMSIIVHPRTSSFKTSDHWQGRWSSEPCEHANKTCGNIKCNVFSRMRSKGSRFTLGAWGLRVCSLDVAFTVATVRNRSQPSVRSPYGRAYGKFCRSGHFWRFQTCRCFVSRGRRGTS